MSKIYVPLSKNNFISIKIANVIYCLGEGSYTKIYYIDGSSCIISKLLKEFEKVLAKKNFFRINNKQLINLNYIKNYFLGKEPKVVLINDIEIPISRRKKEEFKQKLKSVYVHV